MLFSIDTARRILSKLFLVFPGGNVIGLWLFLGSMYGNDATASRLHLTLCATAFLGGLGVWHAFIMTYRSGFGSRQTLWTQVYFFSVIGLLLSSSGWMLALTLAGRPELHWIAVAANTLCVSLALLSGMYLDARRMGWRRARITGGWRAEIEKHIDYTAHQVFTSLTAQKPPRYKFKHPFWIVAIGGANIPLLFELYGGGRPNAILFAAPLVTVTVIYTNVATFGPTLLRILLLRRLEKEVGYRFQNADYEQIQELRRGFFLAKWLMKDYRPPQSRPVGDTPTAKVPRKEQKRNHRR